MSRPTRSTASPARTLRGSLPGLQRTGRHLRPHLRRERPLILGGFLALFAEVAFRILEPWPLTLLIDDVLVPAAAGVGTPAGTGTLLLILATAVLLAVALRALASFLSTVAFALAGNRVLTQVRAELFAHVQRLSLAYHDRTRTGDLVTRMTGDIGRLQEVAVTALLPLVGNVVTLVALSAVMLVLDWRLALVALAVFPFFALDSRRAARSITTVARAQREQEGRIAATAVETLGAMKVVQAYSLEAQLSQRFALSNRKSLKDGVRARRLAAGLERKTDVLVGVATALVLYVGAQRTLAGALTPGELVLFLTYLKTAFNPLRDLAKYTGRIARASACGERVVQTLETKPEIVDAPWAHPARRFLGDVRFEGVSASYGPHALALRQVDLHVRPGQRVGIVGPSGSGKSTLVSLLMRLQDPVEGRIRIDGHDIRDLTIDSVRAQIAVVLQESVLFATTVRENIAYGRVGATDAEIEAAARLANAHEFVLALPEGYDTVLGERGSTLSGGQRQRIAVARAALRDAPLLVLDEATTGLDQDNEAEVRSALYELSRGRTTFIVAHEPAAVADCDLVVRIEKGAIVAVGHPHDVFPVAGSGPFATGTSEEQAHAAAC
ncbi:MAG: ABC transporter ATP-binding protein [Geodermatophilaceae bacterium]|nr:ABC transporter ATP-binding protein [Geodermatophilaceae bacterium]